MLFSDAYLEITKRMTLKSFLKGGQEGKEPEHKSPACSSRAEPHEEKGGSNSWVSEESDDEIVISPPSKQDK